MYIGSGVAYSVKLFAVIYCCAAFMRASVLVCLFVVAFLRDCIRFVTIRTSLGVSKLFVLVLEPPA